MFPTYSEIVKTNFTQIVSDYMFDQPSIPTELKVHGRLSAILEILFPDEVDVITVSLTKWAAIAIVPFKVDNSTLTIQCTINFETLEVTAEAI